MDRRAKHCHRVAICGRAAGSACALAAELVHIKVDVIVTVASTPATVAAKRATTAIPVVMVAAGAPVENGLVASLARPGGNVTGSTTLGGEVASKRLDFVKELIPKPPRSPRFGIRTIPPMRLFIVDSCKKRSRRS
jgi:hypothetical protein